MAENDVRQRSVGASSGKKAVGSTGNIRLLNHSDERLTSQSSLLCKLAVISAIATPLLLFALFAIYSTSKDAPEAFRLPTPPRLEGPLQVNSHLLSAERLYEGKLLGPESIVREGGHMYVGTADGKILHIHKGEIRTLAQLGQPPCGGYENEPTCGRPLGMRLDPDGYLIVCDAYLGIYKVNVATGDSHLLLPASVYIDGQKLNFLNDLDISKDGFIYFTDSSKYQRRDYSRDLLSGRATGRLLQYNPLHNTTEVVIERLHFPNGVQLSRYEDFVLVSETGRARILKYTLKGVNARHLTVFADNLPCLPDNIRPSSRGGFWVACGVFRHAENRFNSYDFASTRPWLRWLLAQLPVEWFMSLAKQSAMLIELSSSGEIKRALMDPDGERVRMSSEVEDDGGILYVGSFSEPYVARINTNQMRD